MLVDASKPMPAAEPALQMQLSDRYALVTLEQIQLHATIGCNEWERRTPKKLIVDVSFGLDIHQAAQSDALADTVDYAKVTHEIRAYAQASEFQLLEALIDAMADLLLETFSLPWVRLRLTKPGVLTGVAAVTLCIERFHPEASQFQRAFLPL